MRLLGIWSFKKKIFLKSQISFFRSVRCLFSTSVSSGGLYSQTSTTVCPRVEWSHRLLWEKRLLPPCRISVAERCVKLCHQTKPRHTKHFFSGVSDLCVTSQRPRAEMRWKLTLQSALICLIIDCNQQGAELKARNSGYNKWLMAESNCRGPRQACNKSLSQQMHIISNACH